MATDKLSTAEVTSWVMRRYFQYRKKAINKFKKQFEDIKNGNIPDIYLSKDHPLYREEYEKYTRREMQVVALGYLLMDIKWYFKNLEGIGFMKQCGMMRSYDYDDYVQQENIDLDYELYEIQMNIKQAITELQPDKEKEKDIFDTDDDSDDET